MQIFLTLLSFPFLPIIYEKDAGITHYSCLPSSSKGKKEPWQGGIFKSRKISSFPSTLFLTLKIASFPLIPRNSFTDLRILPTSRNIDFF